MHQRDRRKRGGLESRAEQEWPDHFASRLSATLAQRPDWRARDHAKSHLYDGTEVRTIGVSLEDALTRAPNAAHAILRAWGTSIRRHSISTSG
jgi:hypothetical protein